MPDLILVVLTVTVSVWLTPFVLRRSIGHPSRPGHVRPGRGYKSGSWARVVSCRACGCTGRPRDVLDGLALCPDCDGGRGSLVYAEARWSFLDGCWQWRAQGEYQDARKGSRFSGPATAPERRPEG